MKALMANPLLGILVAVPLMVIITLLEGLTVLPAEVERFRRTRIGFLLVALVLVVPFAVVVIGRFVYLH